METRLRLTDRFVASVNTPPGDYRDTVTPGLALRVRSSGHKSFVLRGRFPSEPATFTRRTLARVGEITLEEARAKARGWLELMRKGIDPRAEEDRQRAREQTNRVNNFEFVAREFIRIHVANLARPKDTARVIERQFISRWGPRPIVEIQPSDIKRAIRTVSESGPYAGYTAFACIRSLFHWAVANDFGLSASSNPVLGLKATALIGKERAHRQRTLADKELRAVWEACNQMGYPFGDLIKLLLLTGQRRDEIANLNWDEIDLAKRQILIPASR
ncbi:MAG: integrase family protein, partial [Rhizomicrobium sp.]